MSLCAQKSHTYLNKTAGSFKYMSPFCGDQELRYYTTFKVKKLESLFYKINTFAKNYRLHWIAGRTNILSKYIIYIFFSSGRGFYGSFPILFLKTQASCCKKKLELIFAALCFYIYELKKIVSDF